MRGPSTGPGLNALLRDIRSLTLRFFPHRPQRLARGITGTRRRPTRTDGTGERAGLTHCGPILRVGLRGACAGVRLNIPLPAVRSLAFHVCSRRPQRLASDITGTHLRSTRTDGTGKRIDLTHSSRVLRAGHRGACAGVRLNIPLPAVRSLAFHLCPRRPQRLASDITGSHLRSTRTDGTGERTRPTHCGRILRTGLRGLDDGRPGRLAAPAFRVRPPQRRARRVPRPPIPLTTGDIRTACGRLTGPLPPIPLAPGDVRVACGELTGPFPRVP
jgi:hypothetical protein